MKFDKIIAENSEYGIESKIFDTSDFDYQMCLCISEKIENRRIEAEKILSSKELDKFNSFGSEKRKNDFLLGRYSAKRALSFLKKHSFMREINIDNGVFNQPILFDNEFDVTISHSGNFGGAIVFDKRFPTGLDLEKIDESSQKALASYINKEEINENSIQKLTIAWTLKEALSKALRCGLVISSNLLEIENFRENEGIFACEFRHFHQYTGKARLFKDLSSAIVTPVIKNL